MKLNKKAFENIKRLLEGEVIRGKNLSKKEPYNFLKLNGSIVVEKVTAQREKAYLLSFENLFLALQNQGYNITNIEGVNEQLEAFSKTSPRDEIQKLQTSTKAKRSPSLKGLFVSALDDVNVKLNGDDVVIKANNGMSYFFFHTEKIEISKELVIVGVENYQALWFAKKYERFFEGKKFLFISVNAYMLEWIEGVENEYIHFGDFDLAGLNIYANRVVPHLKKCNKHSYFIPSNIEELIEKYGDPALYLKQLRYKETSLGGKELEALRDVMIHHKKVVEQEGIIHY